jgi:ADP-ribose pyrophosphatase YjhB (NUDIX family)
MEILGEFFEQDVTGSQAEEGEILYKIRKAARAVIFNRDREIAVMFVSRDGYHKLPGGGVERDEDLEMALKREVAEEMGCNIEIRPQSIGVIIEYRNSHKLLQISYCFIADAVGDKPGEISYTEREKEQGLQLEWMRLDEAIEVLGKEAPTEYVGQFIHKRDLLFLQRAKEIINQ